ncbi:GDNF family receptor alpha-2-like [Protopterus annectens]|uniref:GDNF family receptor alpha-2-like n=1 Tax=Protopterus annectens TaxID=7888 RepID=UPI001CFBEC49|nr:GDNF family receptor alpha-2-like [Protopterus annectens]
MDQGVSRLADFHTNCQTTPHTLTGCPKDNYQACLGSYTGLIGLDMTPNYIDESHTSITVSPWCSCRGSGDTQEDCERFLRDFTENTCLKNAIQAFGNGTDVNILPKPPTVPITVQPKTEESSSIQDNQSDNAEEDNTLLTTCFSIQEGGPKMNISKTQTYCHPKPQIPQLVTSPPDKESFIDPSVLSSSSLRLHANTVLPAFLFLTVKLAS